MRGRRLSLFDDPFGKALALVAHIGRHDIAQGRKRGEVVAVRVETVESVELRAVEQLAQRQTSQRRVDTRRQEGAVVGVLVELVEVAPGY
jgi:hypothetical protein